MLVKFLMKSYFGHKRFVIHKYVYIYFKKLSLNSLNLSFGLDIQIFVFEVLKDQILCPWP